MKKILVRILSVICIFTMMAFVACKTVDKNTSGSDTADLSSSIDVSESSEDSQSSSSENSSSETQNSYAVTIIGGTGSGQYENGEQVTATATIPEGKIFVNWVSGEEVISSRNPYLFTATKNITLTAVFEDEPEIDIHEDAVLVERQFYWFNFEEGLENFASSDKAFAFDYKPADNDINTGNGFQFTMWGKDWSTPRLTELITVNVVDNVVSVGIVKALGDGWYRYIIPASDLPVNRPEGATGEETLGSFIVNIIDHAFLLDEAGFFDFGSGDILYKVTVKNGSGAGEYSRGEEATVVADEIEGKTFKEWQVNGQKVSENKTYTFKVKGNVNIVAVYSSLEDIMANSVLIVGDVHLGKEPVCKTNLIKTLQYVKNNERIKVVVFNGDTVDTGTAENYALLDECFETVFGNVAKADRPEFLFNMGNHEFYPNTNCDLHDTDYARETGLFKQFANKWMSQPIGEDESVYMRTIGGISYIIAFPSSSFDGQYDYASCGEFGATDFETLQMCLSEATADNRPCVVATHWPWGYTYGGATYGMANWYVVNQMTELLQNYPSVINVTSHTHFSDLHERDLDQTYYTTVNVGTHCLGKHVNGVESDENGETVTYMNLSGRGINGSVDPAAYSLYWSGTVHFGIGIDFGEDNITIKRINIGKGEDYAHGSWIVPYDITKDNLHDKFYYEAGERAGEALNFAEGEKLSAAKTSVSSGKATISLGFNDVEQYWAVEGYKIEIYNDESQLVYKTWWQSLFWADRGAKSNYSITVSDVPASSAYTAKVYPMDFFGHYCEPLTATIGEQEQPAADLSAYTKTVYAEDGEDFVILNLTDYQLHDGKSTYTSFEIIDELVAKYHPDLITVLGDTAEDNGAYGTTVNFKAFVDYIDALGIPWAPIYGNHDNDGYRESSSIKDVTSEWINATFAAAENCLFTVGPDDVNGNGNYIVNVVNKKTGNIIKSLFFFDSGTSGVDGTHVAFYEKAVAYCKAQNDGVTPESIVFIHIPLPEYRTIYDNEDYLGIAGETPHAHGTTEFFAKIKQLGSTKHVICGHDHKNSFYGQYEGVYLMYCVKLSDGDYFDVDQLGGTAFIIGETTTFDYYYADPAFEIMSKQSFDLPKVENFVSSGKAFTFEYKARDNAINVGNEIKFTFWEGENGWGKRVTGLITVNVVNDTVSGCEGVIEDIGDGWRRVTINCAAMPINTGEGATGEESVSMVYFNVVDHAFLFDNATFVGGTPVLKKYDVNVIHGSGTGTYTEGDEVTVTADVIEGKTFVEWQAGGVRISTDNPYTFTVSGKIKLTAVYDPPITEAKVYLESGFNIELPDYNEAKATTLEFDVYAVNASSYARINIILTDEVGVSTKYYRVTYLGVNTGYNAEGVSCTKIADDTWHVVLTLSELTNGSGTSLGKLVAMSDSGSSNLTGCWIDNIAIYEKTSCTVTVENGTGGGTYLAGSSVTVIAEIPSGKQFVEWQVGGVKVSDSAEYTFTVTGNVILTAVFEDVQAGDTKVMLSDGFSITLPDYDPATAISLEFDVYVTDARSPYTKVYWNLYDADNNYFGYYRITYAGIQATNTAGYSVESKGTDTYHVTLVLSELAGGSGTPGKLVKLQDNGSSVNLDGAWIDNIEFKEGEEPAASGKVMLTSGYSIDLPDYNEAKATTLEFDVYTTSARSPYAKINIVLTDANGVSTKYYRVTYSGVNTGYNAEGVSCNKIADDTWHVVITLGELTNGSGTSLGKLVTMSDNGSSNLTGCWIDNIEFKE